MINFDKFYSKENIVAHTKDYKEAKKNLIFLNDTKKYLKRNIKCYKVYKLICFLHYRIKMNYMLIPLIKYFKYLTDTTKELGDKI